MNVLKFVREYRARALNREDLLKDEVQAAEREVRRQELERERARLESRQAPQQPGQPSRGQEWAQRLKAHIGSNVVTAANTPRRQAAAPKRREIKP